MVGKKIIPRNIGSRGLIFIMAAVLLLCNYGSVAALSDTQQSLYQQGINYFDAVGNTVCGTTATPATTGGSVYILGDSITVRTATAYQQAFQQAGMTAVVDGLSDRSLNGTGAASTDGTDPSNHNLDDGMKAISDDSSEIGAASAVVIALGTNGGDTSDSISAAINAIRTETSSSAVPIYWVDTFGLPNQPNSTFGDKNSGMATANQAIYSQAGSQNYQVVSWAKAVDPSVDPQNPDGQQTDSNKYIDTSDGLGVHPTTAGSSALASLVVSAVNNSAGGAAASTGSGSCTCSGSGSGSTGTGAGGSGNAETAFDYFISQGLSANAAAGLVGNFQQESGADLDTTADNGSHQGIAQWSTTRWATLLSVESGKDPTALTTQLDFVWYELTSPTEGYTATVLAPLKLATTPEAAAVPVFNVYEDPGDGSLPARQANARALYNLYAASAGSIAPGSVSDTSASDCSPTTTTPPTGTTPDFVDLSGPATAAMSVGPLTTINALVIHYTEGNTEGLALATDVLIPEGDGVQFNIGLTGTVYEYFPLTDMQETYHVGDINNHSIGIEITGMDGEALLNNQVQFNSVVNTVQYLCKYYNIPCSNPKGNITGTSAADAQGLLGHDEAPNADNPNAQHSDPDTKIVNGVQYDITTGNVWDYATDSGNSSIHAYMMKLRTALGYNPTP